MTPPPGSTEPAQNPAELLAAALESEEVSDSELEAVDHALAGMMLAEQASASGMGAGKAVMSLDEAQARLSPEILKVLAEKFKGSLTQVRHPDERDQIF